MIEKQLKNKSLQNYVKSKFDKVYKGSVNFITPVIIGYFDIGDYYVELSVGSLPENEEIYGVTVIDKELNKMYDLSKSFLSYEDAIEYIAQLKDM